MRAYGLKSKSGGYLMGQTFLLSRDAVKEAKSLVNDHSDTKWKEIFEVVKVEITEVEA